MTLIMMISLCIFLFPGRQHDVDVGFCSCEAKIATLVRFGLWPTTPQNPKSATSFKLMQRARISYLEGAVPLKSFCDIVSTLNSHDYITYSSQVGLA